jgi:hypothetical protein
MISENAVFRTTTSCNTACVMSSDVSATDIQRLAQSWKTFVDSEEDFVEK